MNRGERPTRVPSRVGPNADWFKDALRDVTINLFDQARVSDDGTPGVAARRVYQHCSPTIETNLWRGESRSVVREPLPTKYVADTLSVTRPLAAAAR
jgi:hypothetical protein